MYFESDSRENGSHDLFQFLFLGWVFLGTFYKILIYETEVYFSIKPEKGNIKNRFIERYKKGKEIAGNI